MNAPSPPVFDAWALPSGFSPPARATAARRVDGAEVRMLAPDPGWTRALAARLRGAGNALRARPARDIAQALGRVGARFLGERDPLRLRALECLPATSGLSPAMASAVLDGMAADWTAERLVALLHADLGDIEALDGFVSGERGRIRAVGPDLCVQVVSGSVPGVAATALLRSLLVKAPTLVKPGFGDVVLPVLLAGALQEEDPVLAEAAAVIYWPGGSEAVEEVALSEADAVTAYGGDTAVRSVRDRVSVTARFVAYHHRVSVGVVGREALSAERRHRTASELAGATAFFDQRGCVSPQVVYVEEGGAADPRAFAREVAVAMTALEESLPGGTLDTQEASALQQLRGTAELLAASGGGAELHHGGNASWTVVFDPEGSLAFGCVGRVVRIVPVADAREVPELLAPLRSHLQTVGLEGFSGGRLVTLADALASVGVSRIAPFAEVPFPPPWWHHDGRGPLRALVRWVDLED